jgi:hypothetical protein
LNALRQGFDTSKWSNKTDVVLPGPLWISGNSSYQTVTGATNTVLLVEPFDWERYKAEVEKSKTVKTK